MPEEAQKTSNTKKYIALGGIALIIIAIGLAIGLSVGNDDDSSSASSASSTGGGGGGGPGDSPAQAPSSLTFPTLSPSPVVPVQTPTKAPTLFCLPPNYTLKEIGTTGTCSNGSRRETIYRNRLRTITGQDILLDPSTPQGKAFAFLLNYDPLFQSSCSVAGLTERYALMTLFFSTEGGSWTESVGWCSGAQHCGWTGVTCSNGVVRSLNLETNNLDGTIPQEMYALSQLRSINLFANSLRGPIPNLQLLSNLREIDFQQNLLTGDVIPFNLPKGLVSYKVSGNRMSGVMPETVDSWTKLQTLWAGRNQLSGTLPTRIGNLKQLSSLYLYENDIKGTIPTELGTIPMKEIWLSNNFFAGSIPQQLWFLGSLELFRLENNVLAGSIETWIGLLTNLKDLRINANNLDGTLPIEMRELTDLVQLHMGKNFWSGNLPDIFANMDALQILEISETELGGPIPTSIFRIPSIETVDMSESDVSGTIPAAFTGADNLKKLHLNDSPNISGSIPSPGLGQLANLRELLVQGTGIVGSMPTTICSLRSNERLDVLEADCGGVNPEIQCNFPDCCTQCF